MLDSVSTADVLQILRVRASHRDKAAGDFVRFQDHKHSLRPTVRAGWGVGRGEGAIILVLEYSVSSVLVSVNLVAFLIFRLLFCFLYFIENKGYNLVV